MKTIKIYSHAHYGDIFYSRILINALSPHFNIEYYHSQSGLVLNDLPNVSEFNHLPIEFNRYTNDNKNGLVNAWIGHSGEYLNNGHGCNFNNHFKLVQKVCNDLQVSIGNPLDYLPYVNYDNLSSISNIKEKMDNFKTKFDKIILFCDGNVRSGQSVNFDFNSIISSLADKYKNYLFISTNNNFNSVNAISLNPHITNSSPDLLDISYISKFCDVIIGRASGPFCYTHTLDNFYDTQKTFISFTHIVHEGVFLDESKCKNIWSNNFDMNSIIKTIDDCLINL